MPEFSPRRADFAVLANPDVDSVSPIEQLEGCLQFVVAIVASTDDMQEQVQFGGRGPKTPAIRRMAKAQGSRHC
jgi:hypothetical protein